MYISPLEQAAMDQMMVEEAGRKAAMTRAWNAYNGNYANPLKVLPGEPDDNIKVNRLRPIVDASVFLLFGAPPSYELPKSTDGENSAERSKPEEDLDRCLEENTFAGKLIDYGINGAVTGTPYWRIVPGETCPRIQVMDPENMSIRWDPRDLDTVTAYIWQFNSIDPQTKRPRVERQLCERQLNAEGKVTHWLITDQHASFDGANNGQWFTDATTIWNYTWPPYLHNKNLPAPNQVYGLPDYVDSDIHLNNKKNFNLSNRNRIDRMHSHPVPWATGIQGVRVDWSPGRLLQLPEGAQVGQLAPAVNSDSSAGLGKELDSHLEEATMTPALLLGRDDGKALPASGIALRIQLRPALTKLELKRTLYSSMLIELYRRLMELMGHGPDCRVSLTWPEPLPVDTLSERQTLLIDQQLGVASKASIAEKLGYDWETERDNLEQETTDLGEKALNDFTNAPGANMQPGQGSKPVDRPNGIEGI